MNNRLNRYLKLLVWTGVFVSALLTTTRPACAWCLWPSDIAVSPNTPVPIFVHPLLVGNMFHSDGHPWSEEEIADAVAWVAQSANYSSRGTHAPLYYGGISETGCDPLVASTCQIPGAIHVIPDDECVAANIYYPEGPIDDTGVVIRIGLCDPRGHTLGGGYGLAFHGALHHEIGHAFGLSHNRDDHCGGGRLSRCDSVMCAVMDATVSTSHVFDAWQPDDIESFEQALFRTGVGYVDPGLAAILHESVDGDTWFQISPPYLESMLYPVGITTGLSDGTFHVGGMHRHAPGISSRNSAIV